MGRFMWAPLKSPCHIFESLCLSPSAMCLPLNAIMAHLFLISSLPAVISCNVSLSCFTPLPPVSCPHSLTYHTAASLSPSVGSQLIFFNYSKKYAYTPCLINDKSSSHCASRHLFHFCDNCNLVSIQFSQLNV
jgi:hypothetical protein